MGGWRGLPGHRQRDITKVNGTATIERKFVHNLLRTVSETNRCRHRISTALVGCHGQGKNFARWQIKTERVPGGAVIGGMHTVKATIFTARFNERSRDSPGQ